MAKGKGRGLGSRGIAGFREISGGFGKNRDGDGAGGDPRCSQRPRGTEAIPKFPFLLLDSRWEKGNVREFRDFREIREIGEMREFREFRSHPAPPQGHFCTLHIPRVPSRAPAPGNSGGKFGEMRNFWVRLPGRAGVQDVTPFSELLLKLVIYRAQLAER